jgi:hypothetical protein
MSSIVPRDDQLVKLLYQDMLHRGYQWSMGRHQHPKPEPFAPGCHSGSFYITTWGNAMRWIRLGRLMYWVADAEPHGEVFATHGKIQVHEVTLSNPRPLQDVIRAMTPEQHFELFEKSSAVISYLTPASRDLELAAVRTRGNAIQYTTQTREFQIAAVVNTPFAFDNIRRPEPDLAEIASILSPHSITTIPREFHTPEIMHRGAVHDVANIKCMPGAPAEYWRAHVSRGGRLRTVMLLGYYRETSPWRFLHSDIMRIVEGWPGAVAYLDSRHLTASVLAAATRAERSGAPMELMTSAEYHGWVTALLRTCPERVLSPEVEAERAEQNDLREERLERRYATRRAERKRRDGISGAFVTSTPEARRQMGQALAGMVYTVKEADQP